MAGINPDAHRKRLELRTFLPDKWKKLKINNLKIGSNSFDYNYDHSNQIININSMKAGWTLNLKIGLNQ
ncbi:MAG: hypothetical protein ACOCRU_02735 [bacterium]